MKRSVLQTVTSVVQSAMDPLSPAITFFDKDGKGRTSYIGSLMPESIFYPTPGLWFTNQGPEVRASIFDMYLYSMRA